MVGGVTLVSVFKQLKYFHLLSMDWPVIKPWKVSSAISDFAVKLWQALAIESFIIDDGQLLCLLFISWQKTSGQTSKQI